MLYKKKKKTAREKVYKYNDVFYYVMRVRKNLDQF